MSDLFNGKPVEIWTDSKRVSETNPFPVGVFTGMVKVGYDYVARTLPASTQELFTFKTGGSGGTTVATITINYTDSSLGTLLNATYVEV